MLLVIPDSVFWTFVLLNLVGWFSIALVVVEMYDGFTVVTLVVLDIVEPTKPHFIEPIELLPVEFDETIKNLKQLNYKKCFHFSISKLVCYFGLLRCIIVFFAHNVSLDGPKVRDTSLRVL